MRAVLERDVTVLLPTLDEAGNIGGILQTIISLYPEYRATVLDDNSQDGTGDIVEAIAQDNERISLLRRNPADPGLSASIFEGIMGCETGLFVVMDADFQHPPECVVGIVNALRDGADLAIGVRAHRRSLSPMRWTCSFAAQFLTHSYLWIHDQPSSRDIMTGFFGGRTELFQKVIGEHGESMDHRGFKALFDLLKFTPARTRVAEVEFEFGTRMAGESKISSTVVFSILGQCGKVGKKVSSLLERAF